MLPISDLRDIYGNDNSMLLIFGGLCKAARPQKTTTLINIDNRDITKTTIADLKTSLPTEESKAETKQPIHTQEMLSHRDRFYFAQFFPIKEKHLSNNFLD